MSILKTLGDGQGYLKGGFLGFQGSGKTYTATLLAIAIRRLFKLTGPIGFIDTENATEYIAPLVVSLTGEPPVGVRTRDFRKLLDGAQECVDAGVSALVVDSMTHFWRGLCDSYLRGVNERRKRSNKPPKYSLEFQDWGKVKDEWSKWTDLFLNSPLHIVICGRAGFEYDMEKNEDSGKTELRKTGIKMKTEAEFGFEPSLLVQMDIDQVPVEGGRGFRQVRKALVLKDRFAEIDGEEFIFSKQQSKDVELELVTKAFGPHLRKLLPGTHSTVETHGEAMDVDGEGDDEYRRERMRREVFCEEITGALVAAGLDGRSAEEKKKRLELLERVFGTRSWKAIETLPSQKLSAGLRDIRDATGLTSSLITDRRPQPDEEDDIPFEQPKAPATAEAKPQPPPQPKPSPPNPAENNKPAVSACQLSDEVREAVLAVIDREPGDLKRAVDWMSTSQRGQKAWINDGNLDDLTPRHAAAITASEGRTFRRAVGLSV